MCVYKQATASGVQARPVEGAAVTAAFPGGNVWVRLEEEREDVVVAFSQGAWETQGPHN